MPFVLVRCPVCGEENEINSDSEFFYCIHCGRQAITQAAICFSAPTTENDTDVDINESVVIEAPPTTTPEEEQRYLKRIFLFLEEGDWERAKGYCESVLDFNPECAPAYLAKLMTKLRIREKTELTQQEQSYEEEFEWRFALRFADKDFKEELESYSAECERHIYALNEAKAKAKADDEARARTKAESEARAKAEAEAEIRQSYLQALGLLKGEPTESNYLEALSLLQSIPFEYEQSAILAEQAKEHLYVSASNLQAGFTTTAHEKALQIFERLGTYKDSNSRAEQLRKAL